MLIEIRLTISPVVWNSEATNVISGRLFIDRRGLALIIVSAPLKLFFNEKAALPFINSGFINPMLPSEDK